MFLEFLPCLFSTPLVLQLLSSQHCELAYSGSQVIGSAQGCIRREGGGGEGVQGGGVGQTPPPPMVVDG